MDAVRSSVTRGRWGCRCIRGIVEVAPFVSSLTQLRRVLLTFSPKAGCAVWSIVTRLGKQNSERYNELVSSTGCIKCDAVVDIELACSSPVHSLAISVHLCGSGQAKI